MSEPWAQRPRWMIDEQPDEECGTYNALFWIVVGAICGVVAGLVAWKLRSGQ